MLTQRALPIAALLSATLLSATLLSAALLSACQPPIARPPARAAEPEAAAVAITTPEAPAPAAEEPGPGEPFGEAWITYYHLAVEPEAEPEAGAEAARSRLFDRSCAPLARVTASFERVLRMEGSGRLRDGRVINVAGRCRCGGRSRICYAALEASRFPWGQGNRGNALRPLVSVATDPAQIPSGTRLYAPEWDGVVVPEVEGLGGFVHDGCFVAADTGGGIEGRHIDLFAGSQAMWRALEGIRPTRSTLTLFRDSPRCQEAPDSGAQSTSSPAASSTPDSSGSASASSSR